MRLCVRHHLLFGPRVLSAFYSRTNDVLYEGIVL